ncbi:hypothetical protein ILT44_30325 [Microvirga sp. BT689]|uniref:helix-turn-helix domain-containing protein n=1 Tax=Microvirga arvi TaxID=2778731 RepID=UPI00194F021E|nr:hypothetical protein [Microvirga arvi]
MTDPATETIDKWEACKLVEKAAGSLGIRPRALTVLKAVVSFHEGNSIDKNSVVWAPNKKLLGRCNGISAPTLVIRPH